MVGILHFQYSWQQFLYTKCQNINRKPSTSSSNTPTKRLKVEEDKHLYPSVLTDMDDEIAHERNRKLLKEEIAKPKLRFDIAQELMRRTFGKRRRWILDGENLKTTMIVEEYPLLRKPLFVSFLTTILFISFYSFSVIWPCAGDEWIQPYNALGGR